MQKSKINEIILNPQKRHQFIKMWNGKDCRKLIAFYFKISIQTTRKVRDKLNLFKKDDYKNHPYQKNLNKRIKKLYLKGYSTITIAKIKGISHESVRRRLQYIGIELRRANTRNVLYNKYPSGAKHDYSPNFLRKEIKKLYEKGLSIRKIAIRLNINKNTVERRIRKMDIFRISLKINKASPIQRGEALSNHQKPQTASNNL